MKAKRGGVRRVVSKKRMFFVGHKEWLGMKKGSQLPFAALSSGSNAPLNNFITDTHFSSRDRMGRLVAFSAKSNLRGLGVDEETAVLIPTQPWHSELD